MRLIQGYYLASPLFLIISILGGTEVRVNFIQDPLLRFGYYVVLSGLGLLTHFKPASAPWVAVGESSLNLGFIIFWIMLPIYGLTGEMDTLVEGLPYTPRDVLINGALAGSFVLVGFYKAQSVLLARMPWLGPHKGSGSGAK